MPLVTDYNHCLELFAEAREHNWVLPDFNSENLTTSEAILQGVKEYGDSIGIQDLPVIIGITNNYPPRPQTAYYTHTRNWEIGLKLFLADLKELTSPGSPFEQIRVMIHLDHILYDQDKELLNRDIKQFSSIMFDASALRINNNIQKTADFVQRNKGRLIIEGACDEISKYDDKELTSPETAERFFRETGVDIIVANLGSEHRASSSTLLYSRDIAREISMRLGTILCLHGTSSLSTDQLRHLFKDGICKVNVWTTLERNSTPVLFNEMLRNASKIVGQQTVIKLKQDQLLGKEIEDSSALSIDYSTTTYRQHIIFNKMKEIVKEYLNIWYTL